MKNSFSHSQRQTMSKVQSLSLWSLFCVFISIDECLNGQSIPLHFSNVSSMILFCTCHSASPFVNSDTVITDGFMQWNLSDAFTVRLNIYSLNILYFIREDLLIRALPYFICEDFLIRELPLPSLAWHHGELFVPLGPLNTHTKPDDFMQWNLLDAFKLRLNIRSLNMLYFICEDLLINLYIV